MEVTFIWSWFSFWVGFASVFVGGFALAVVFALINAIKQAGTKRRLPAGSLDDFISLRKNK